MKGLKDRSSRKSQATEVAVEKGYSKAVAIEKTQAKSVAADIATRTFLAKAVVICGLVVIVGAAGFAFATDGAKNARDLVGNFQALIGVVLGYYFAKTR